MTAIHPSLIRFVRLLLFWLRLASWRAVACIVICVCAVSNAAACPLEAPRSRLTDLAGLPGLHANTITDRLAAYQQASGHQLFVLVVPSLDRGMSIEECAVAVFQNWKIGRKGVDDGVLLLIAVKERKMRIEVGYGLEGVLTDAKSSRIIREVMQPMFARGEFAEGTDRGLAAIMAVIGSANVEHTVEQKPFSLYAAADKIAGVIVAVVMMLLVVLASTILGIAGLLTFGVAAACVAYWLCPGWPGYMMAAACGIIWCAARWRMIRANVHKHHLKKSSNKTLTWIGCFMAFGTAEPARNWTTTLSSAGFASADDGFSYSLASSGEVEESSSDDSSDSSSECGGASGGGGASGNW